MNQALGNDVGAKLSSTASDRVADKMSVTSFATDTAANTGFNERTVRRSIHRAENIAPEVRNEIRNMREIANSGVELDALANVSPEEQRAAVDDVKQGKAKTIREALVHGLKSTSTPPKASGGKSLISMLFRINNNMSKSEREALLRDFADALGVLYMLKEPADAAAAE
jgi:hypothetical protein